MTAEDVRTALRVSRQECQMYGHDWDVADAMGVFTALGLVPAPPVADAHEEEWIVVAPDGTKCRVLGVQQAALADAHHLMVTPERPPT